MNELRAILTRLTAAPGESAGVLVTLVTVAGSSYRRPGARLLLTPEGERIGSISGGCLEEDVLAHARRVAVSGLAELVAYDTTSENDLVWGVGLGCHGVVQLLVEKLPPAPAWAAALAANRAAHRPTCLAVVWRSSDPAHLGTTLAHSLPPLPPEAAVFYDEVLPPVHLAIFGAGNDAQPLARFADELGWRVTVADPRPEFTTEARFPTAAVRVVAPADELVARAALPSDALAVVMTHRYVHDVPVLRELLARPPAYIGLLGPRQRAERILADLDHERPVTPEARACLHAPVGLDLGGSTPEEVALSIIAEMRAVLGARDARPLRDRRAPIHG